MIRKAEEIRLRYLYRNLVLRKKITLPFKAALKFVGPDCAYHLYSFLEPGKVLRSKVRSRKSKV